ncbi:FAD-containing monooxygenase EthA [Colletotrichum trifolii]|uniref:FAD-containing monooxygenase EthA n=1 Tax=Colletotrichum trifolii TaxID=5466 RepID=A0A4R8R4X1_COLTR|nr:FAD-containing monooxygenase EthA [Colletotrichum trifolii]
MDSTPSSTSVAPCETLDFLIIGAGISGINSAYYLQSKGPPSATYAVLEGRNQLGGTWDLFRYPGIRSDSDIYTFGFSWKPWKGNSPLASGPAILSYLQESVEEQGIDKQIRFNHQVTSAAWSTADASWTLQVTVAGEKVRPFKARFLVLGTGYYDYEQPLNSEISGICNFTGEVVHPQFWPKDLDYRNKNLVIIGSGATAVTLLPNLATEARHTTMLQRSPTYIAAMPTRKAAIIDFILSVLPSSISNGLLRMSYMLFAYALYCFCTMFPRLARWGLLRRVAQELPPTTAIDPHFNPKYDPWQQRLCVCPDADFFAALRSGKADVVTDIIKTVTDKEIVLQSGKTLSPDIIITATGLRIRFAGAISISVDGSPIQPNEKFAYKGCMLQDIPNLAFVFGYANSSWTLGAEATSVFLARLWHRMESSGIRTVTPYLGKGKTMQPQPVMGLTSTYVQHAASVFPKAGSGLWAARTFYLEDLWRGKFGNVLAGMQTA